MTPILCRRCLQVHHVDTGCRLFRRMSLTQLKKHNRCWLDGYCCDTEEAYNSLTETIRVFIGDTPEGIAICPTWMQRI